MISGFIDWWWSMWWQHTEDGLHIPPVLFLIDVDGHQDVILLVLLRIEVLQMDFTECFTYCVKFLRRCRPREYRKHLPGNDLIIVEEFVHHRLEISARGDQVWRLIFKVGCGCILFLVLIGEVVFALNLFRETCKKVHGETALSGLT